MPSSMPPAWKDIPAAELPSWTTRLLPAGASLFQLPYWNEALAVLGFAPRYLHRTAGGEAFACVLRIGPPGARMGLVQRGPVLLGERRPDDVHDALESLVAWARAQGYFFLRFTHGDAALLDAAASLPRARRDNGFPFYRDPHERLLVDLNRGDLSDVLAGFQQLARRKIRKAEGVGYRISRSAEAADLAGVWPLFEGLARRKGFSFRPRRSFEVLMEQAGSYDGTWLYTAWRDNQPVEAILVARDATTGYFISGALDVEKLEGAESPSALLHWTAIQDLAQAHAAQYDLGTRSGVVYEFKRIFRPHEVVHPEPVTVVTGPIRYALWSATVLRLRGRTIRRMKAAAAGFIRTMRGRGAV